MIENAKPVVVGIGEVLWDMLPSGKQPGGAPANFIYHAGTLGAEAHMVSRVGNDGLGREIVDRLRELGLNTGLIGLDESHPTGTVEVRLDGQGKPTYDIRRNVAWDFIPFSPELRALAERADAVCLSKLRSRISVSRRARELSAEAFATAALLLSFIPSGIENPTTKAASLPSLK